MEQHANVRAVQRALDAAEARDGSGKPSAVTILPDAAPTAVAAAELGIGALKRAKPEFVRSHTGQPIGGVAPVAHPKPLRTLVDDALRQYPEVWAAGGIPHAVFPIAPDELVRISGGIVTEVS